MKLNFKRLGEGPPLIILHGLLGSLDNWQTLGKQFAESGYSVYLLDARNHGQSPHSDDWNYRVMMQDIVEFLDDQNLDAVHVLGHSMGGKTAMLLAATHPHRVSSLIVADMAPVTYRRHHEDVLEAIGAVDFDFIKSRQEAHDVLSRYLKEEAVIQFLLKNIYWTDRERLDWRFNFDVINRDYDEVTANPVTGVYEGPVLFIRGGKSRYVKDEAVPVIQKHFPKAEVSTIENAGHWLHAEAPREFFNQVTSFLSQH